MNPLLIQLDDKVNVLELKSPVEKFIQKVDGEIMISNNDEVIFKVKVLNLIQALEPIQYFYLSGQRSVDEDRVGKLFQSQLEEYQQKQHYGITMTMIVLGFCQHHVGDPIDDKCKLLNKNQHGLVVLDGQHRLAVLRRLKMCHENTLSKEVTLVKICRVSKEFDLREYFQVINKNYVPVPMYNLDDQIRGIVDDVLNWFKNSFDAKFFKSPSGETLRPFVKIETIRDKLSNSHSLHDLIIENEGEREKCVTIVCNKFLTYNRYLASLSSESFSHGSKDFNICENAHLKCLSASKPLYLGMKKSYTWIEEAFGYKTPIVVRPKTLL